MAFSPDTRLDNTVRKKQTNKQTNKKNPLFLSANVFSTKAPIEDVIFFLRLFVEDGTTIIRPAVCRAFEVPSFLSSFSTQSIEVLIWPWESNPMTFRSLQSSALPTELILPR